MSRDPDTYGRVRKQFDNWTEMEANRPARPYLKSKRTYTPEHRGSDMGKTVFPAIGIGIGLVILSLALYAFYTANQWAQVDRESAVVGYTLVGFFLTISGLGAVIGTWNHFFRVLARPGGAQAHHH